MQLKDTDSVKEYLNCLRCGRVLRNPKSIKVGMGTVCKRKYDQEHQERTECGGTNETTERSIGLC